MNVQLTPMPDDRLAEWILASQEAFRLSRIEAGESEELAGLRAAESTERFFGTGAPLPLHQVFDVVIPDAGGTVVGYLWIGPQFGSTSDWWVWDVEIAEAHRRNGYARQALQLGEAEARALGAQSIGLNVFGFNTGAQALYETLGYRIAAVNMSKRLN
ncbi:GNAT family N-acetyltransferase [Microterricola pindariensis]|uniref:N-acetyltransferase domain-containing protein n=1 Tax=Microterricola pindariensis TaxID=478010 RepID=A0ABX5AZT7_9MICO|nr:GNAT family N-acetyltransferase [Microterricola pindariensis]PPL19896.1 hypothetical protein GY24_03855 [Microterricola pindariensis]